MEFEPAVVIAATETTSTIVVSLQVTNEVAMTCGTTVSMSPSIGGYSGGTANGTATCNVTSTGAYHIALNATGSPALIHRTLGSGTNFANYTPSTANVPDYTWSVAGTAAEFGYTISSTKPATVFKNDGGACNAGSNNPDGSKCWLNASTTPVTVISDTDNSGSHIVAHYFKFQAESGTSNVQPQGWYDATIKITATAD